MMKIGWTSAIAPVASAPAWHSAATMTIAIPASHTLRRASSTISDSRSDRDERACAAARRCSTAAVALLADVIRASRMETGTIKQVPIFQPLCAGTACGGLVDFPDDADHRLIREAITAICARFPDEYWADLDATHTFPWAFYEAMAEGGWIGIAIPAEFDGGGAAINEASIILEEVAASGACMNGASAIHLSIFGMHPVVMHGSEEMKRQYLPSVADGTLHVAFGVTEPDAGTDTTKITTRAERDGDRYVVNGRKVWTSKALEA